MSRRDRPAPIGRRSTWAGLVAVAMLVTASCRDDVRSTGPASDATGSTIVPGSTIEALPAVDGPFAAGRTPLAGFGEVAVRITAPDGTVRVLCMLRARSDAQRQRGLMTVTDPELGGYDGMLFEFDDDVTGRFWMRNTPLALSIAYIDDRGRLVSSSDMAPCRDSARCPTYPARVPYRMAVEVPRGGLSRLGIEPGSQLARAGACAPLG